MKVQGYIEIDYQAMTGDQLQEFNKTMRQFCIYYYRVHKGDRDYYFCILEDISVLPTLLEFMDERNPVINGLWDIEGTPYGQIKQVDAETGEVTITGDAEYSFDLDMHLIHTPDESSMDEDGNITKVTVTEFKPLHSFSGWELCQEY